MEESKKHIHIIQNILKKQNRYDLSIKLENAHYKHYWIDGWNGGIGGVDISVHPNNYMELNQLSDEDRDLLIELFNGLPHEYSSLEGVGFSIDTNITIENISDAIYIFVDEAGDIDFSKKGSKYYMFTFLIKTRPFNLHETISSYRYSLLERNLNPLNTNGGRIDIEYFHACYDNKHIKNEIFRLISTFDKKSVKAYSYMLEKPKVLPEKVINKDSFYIDNLEFAIKKLLDKLKIQKDFIIITDRLPVHKNKNMQIKGLKQGIKEYIEDKSLGIKYDIFHHHSASSVNLQIVDYMSWAIFRKHEHKDPSYFNRIKEYFIDIDDMTKDREKIHYEV